MKAIRGLFPVLLILTLIYFMNNYALSGLQVLFNEIDLNTIRNTLISLFWIIPYSSALLAILGLFEMNAKHKMGFWGSLGFNSLITVLFTQLTLVLVIFSGDLFRVFEGFFFYGMSLFEHSTMGQLKFPERSVYVAQLALLLGAVPLISFIYGIVKGKYNYKIHKHVLTFKDLPEAFDGFKITQISDIHSGSLENKKAVSDGIDLINQQNADLFLFTGDLVNNNAEEFIPWKEVFKKIKAPFGQFSVLGNHDYGDYRAWPSAEAKRKNHQDIIEHHEHMGFKLLRDENTFIEKDGQKISLIGVQNWGKGFIKIGDLSKALEGVAKDAFKILMSHDPTHFEHEVKNHDTHIHLTLSGHTHGMQMGIELPWIKWSPVKWIYPRWAGIYEENGRFININRGFGFIGFGGRVGIWPEISVIELRRG